MLNVVEIKGLVKMSVNQAGNRLRRERLKRVLLYIPNI